MIDTFSFVILTVATFTFLPLNIDDSPLKAKSVILFNYNLASVSGHIPPCIHHCTFKALENDGWILAKIAIEINEHNISKSKRLLNY